jgi:hypothetical protein
MTLFAFPTADANQVGAPSRGNARHSHTWMEGSAGEALQLQQPLADGALVIVARGEKKGEGGPAA